MFRDFFTVDFYVSTAPRTQNAHERALESVSGADWSRGHFRDFRGPTGVKNRPKTRCLIYRSCRGWPRVAWKPSKKVEGPFVRDNKHSSQTASHRRKAKHKAPPCDVVWDGSLGNVTESIPPRTKVSRPTVKMPGPRRGPLRATKSARKRGRPEARTHNSMHTSKSSTFGCVQCAASDAVHDS